MTFGPNISKVNCGEKQQIELQLFILMKHPRNSPPRHHTGSEHNITLLNLNCMINGNKTLDLARQKMNYLKALFGARKVENTAIWRDYENITLPKIEVPRQMSSF